MPATRWPRAGRWPPERSAAHRSTGASERRDRRGGPALELRDVEKRFGATEIIRGVTLDVRRGERLAIIGPNGAGKSTLFNLISGRLRPTKGSIRLNGEEIAGAPPYRVNRRGLARSFQVTNIFPRLSVFENIRCSVLWSLGYKYNFWRRADSCATRTSGRNETLEQIRMTARRDTPAGVLTYAEQRALEIGITIAGDAGVILLDEPTAGMSRSEADHAVELIRSVSQGRTLVMVEHDMGVVFDLADRISVLVYGEIIATDVPARIRENAAVQTAYLGSAAMLEVDDLHAYYGKSHILQGISFRVGEGEIVSLLGRNGAGRSTAIKTIMGHVPAVGCIRFKGERIDRMKTHEIARRGLGYVPEDRAIFPTLTVRENLTLGMKPAAGPARWSQDDVFALFPMLRERVDAPGGVLSGGEQQLLTICRTLMGDPDLIMVDEPTEGLAPMVVERVRGLLEKIASRGVAILLIEQKLTIALAISHRLYVMGQGRIVFEGTAEQLRDNEAVRKEWLEI